jgi:hypothetical protein
MTVRWSLNLWSNDQGQGTIAIPADVKTTAAWESRDSFHTKVVNGRWDGSDLVGRGGSLYLSGSQERFRLTDFKPFEQNYDTSGYRVGDKGSGTWLNPWFTAASTDITWEIVAAVRGGSLFTILTTDDGTDGQSVDDNSATA